jgi:hypothetical protein
MQAVLCDLRERSPFVSHEGNDMQRRFLDSLNEAQAFPAYYKYTRHRSLTTSV